MQRACLPRQRGAFSEGSEIHFVWVHKISEDRNPQGGQSRSRTAKSAGRQTSPDASVRPIRRGSCKALKRTNDNRGPISLGSPNLRRSSQLARLDVVSEALAL